MQNDTERRALPRREVNRPARIRLHEDEQARGAIVKNLSGGGVLLWLDQPLDTGRVFDITIEPESELAAPLRAQVKVLRCTRLAPGRGSFAIACQIERLLG
jgi:hypothetical protein